LGCGLREWLPALRSAKTCRAGTAPQRIYPHEETHLIHSL